MKDQRSEWKRLYSMLQKPRHRYFQYVFVESFFRSIVPVITAFVLKWTIDAAVSDDMGSLWKAFYILSAATLLFASLSPWLIYWVKRSAKQSSVKLRSRLLERLSFFPVSFYEQNQSGEIMSRMSNDVHQMEEMFTEHTRNLIHFLIVGAGSLTGMIILDWRFAIALIFLTVVIGWVNYRFIQPLRTISDTLQQQKGEANARTSDLLYGLSMIKLYQLEPVVINQYDEVNRKVRDITKSLGQRTALLDAINYLATYISFGGIAILGAFLVMKGSIATGTLIALIQLQMNVTFVILLVSALVARMQVSAAASARVNGLLESEVENDVESDSESTVQMADDRNYPFAIEIEDVFYAYGQQAVLKGICFSVRHGETAAIIGGSGNGKSTICKLLLGYYRPSSGNIKLFGVHYSHSSLADWRRIIAYVPQEPFLFTGSIEDNIKFGNLSASDDEIRAAAINAGADEFIQALPMGYKTTITQDAANLSGGQKQRITIARAFLKDAPILLLDEPTSSLDAESVNVFADVLNRMKGKKTCLIIAHESKALYQADVVFEVANGVIQSPTKQYA